MSILPNGDDAANMSRFFGAVLIFVAANSWNTVFSELFQYYKPKTGAYSALQGAILFSILLTIIAVVYARYNIH